MALLLFWTCYVDDTFKIDTCADPMGEGDENSWIRA